MLYMCPEAKPIWKHFVAFYTKTLFILMNIFGVGEQSMTVDKALTTNCAQVIFFENISMISVKMMIIALICLKVLTTLRTNVFFFQIFCSLFPGILDHLFHSNVQLQYV